MVLTTIESLLTEARRCHRCGDPSGKARALREAWEAAEALPATHPARHHVAWKRARALQLAGGDALAAVRPLFDDPDVDPFAHYPRAVPGASALARHHQDTRGYGDPTVRAIWTALATHQRSVHHRVGWAHAILQLAWDAACTGELDRLDAHLLEVERSPVDTLTVDAAHTALRGAVWCGDAVRADDAMGALLDATHGRARAPVVSEALLEAAVHLGGPLPSHAPGDDPFRQAYAAVLAGEGDPMEAAGRGRAHGPEWALAVHATAALQGRPLPGTDDLVDATGCQAFARASAPRTERRNA
jgi:hypothetical protein